MPATYTTAAEAYSAFAAFDKRHRAAFDSDHGHGTDDMETLDRVWAARQHAQAEHTRLSQ